MILVILTASKNSKAVKKVHPCKVEVTDYGSQKVQGLIATCSTADMQNQHSSEDSIAITT